MGPFRSRISACLRIRLIFLSLALSCRPSDEKQAAATMPDSGVSAACDDLAPSACAPRVAPTEVSARCDSTDVLASATSCQRFRLGSAATTLRQPAVDFLRSKGFGVEVRPELQTADAQVAEVTLPANEAQWSEIDQQAFPQLFRDLIARSPEVVRTLKLALWLRSQADVLAAMPLYEPKSHDFIHQIADDPSTYPSGDFLGSANAKLVRLAENWRAMQAANYLGGEVRLAIIDGGYTTAYSDLANPIDIGPMDTPGWKAETAWHGHFVAQLAGAVGNNGQFSSGTSALAAAGLDWVQTPPALRIMRVHSGPTDLDIAVAINQALDQGADILNMSFGFNCDSVCQFFGYLEVFMAYKPALNRARELGVLVFASAGNEGLDLDASDVFVAPCEFRALLTCVGAVDSLGSWANLYGLGEDGNHGSAVEVYAPGAGLHVAEPATYPTNGPITTVYGSSFASPFVAGVAAGVVARSGRIGINGFTTLLRRTVSTSHGLPILDAAALFHDGATVADDGVGVDAEPFTQGRLLSLTNGDTDRFTLSAARCEQLTFTVDYIPFAPGAQPRIEIRRGGTTVPTTTTDTPGRRVLQTGSLDAAEYEVLMGAGVDLNPVAQAPVAYSMSVSRSMASGCDNAEFVSMSIPSVAEAGARYRASVVVRNTGPTTWRPDEVVLTALAGKTAFAVADARPSAFFPPGATSTIDFELVAPLTPGTYQLQLKMARGGTPFGTATALANVQVIAPSGIVASFEPSEGIVPPRVLCPPAVYRYSMVNRGSRAWDVTDKLRLQLYRRGEGSLAWQPWLSAEVISRVEPGAAIVVDVPYTTINREDTGVWSVRAGVLRDGVQLGTASEESPTSINIFDNSGGPSATFASIAAPAGLQEGEDGIFDVRFRNTGCVTWYPEWRLQLLSVRGNWTPAAITASETVPVGGELRLRFSARPDGYFFANNQVAASMPTQWALKFNDYHYVYTEVREVPIGYPQAACEAIVAPASVRAGQTFEAYMRMRNTGGTTWTSQAGYRLGYLPPGATTWGPSTVDLNSEQRIDPGGVAEFRFTATAPTQAGSYPFFWMMYRNADYFFAECGLGTDIAVTN
jgi:hypothetical protein